MKWEIIDSGIASAEENMLFDKSILDSVDEHSLPTLHLYDWKESSATYGYFTDPDEHLIAEKVREYNLKLARRPTGGGIIFHTHDFAFSVLIPSSHPRFSLNTLENYAFINEAVIEAIALFTKKTTSPHLFQAEDCDKSCLSRQFCMAQPTKYDVMIKGKKVGGAAQRRTKNGFLHQGTISLARPSEKFLKDILKNGASVIDAMTANSYSLLPENHTDLDLQEARNALKLHLTHSLLAR